MLSNTQCKSAECRTEDGTRVHVYNHLPGDGLAPKSSDSSSSVSVSDEKLVPDPPSSESPIMNPSCMLKREGGGTGGIVN